VALIEEGSGEREQEGVARTEEGCKGKEEGEAVAHIEEACSGAEEEAVAGSRGGGRGSGGKSRRVWHM